ncbi:MAG: hypothetical protein ACRC2O_01010, partial [Chitinophagaceae bacterium]
GNRSHLVDGRQFYTEQIFFSTYLFIRCTIRQKAAVTKPSEKVHGGQKCIINKKPDGFIL